jgi:hypothetical protein
VAKSFFRSLPLPILLAVCPFSAGPGLQALAQDTHQKVDIDWDKTVIVSKSTPTLQVVTNPMLNPGSPIHDGSFAALKALGADYVRYVPWLPYPKIAVAELEPPPKKRPPGTSLILIPSPRTFLQQQKVTRQSSTSAPFPLGCSRPTSP